MYECLVCEYLVYEYLVYEHLVYDDVVYEYLVYVSVYLCVCGGRRGRKEEGSE